MPELTSWGEKELAAIAERHGISYDAAMALLDALVRGHGNLAQFNIPELGGMGQWMRGGMTMVGDMFNSALKTRVERVCAELSDLMSRDELAARNDTFRDRYAEPGATEARHAGPLFRPRGPAWWPEGLGQPQASGSQDGMRYAYFAAPRRLAIETNGVPALYDTRDHLITGVAQQQAERGNLAFTSQKGAVRLSDLRRLTGEPRQAQPDTGNEPKQAEPPSPESMQGTRDSAGATAQGSDPIALIERLASLKDRGMLTDEEFESKKAELLKRL